MDPSVGVKGSIVGGNNGIPDYDFGIRDILRVVRWVRGGDVGEDLLGVPVEERGEVGVEIEGYVGVFFAFGAVVVWTTSGAVECISLGKMAMCVDMATYTRTFLSSRDADGS